MAKSKSPLRDKEEALLYVVENEDTKIVIDLLVKGTYPDVQDSFGKYIVGRDTKGPSRPSK